jgi:muramoyltetrapeptide carboxypeptidase
MFGSPSASPFTAERFLQVLSGETTGPVPEDRDRLTVVSIAGGRASGRLVGGCLVDFIYTIGTPWEPDLDGTIFFFEECNSAPIQIDRALLHLQQIGSSKAFGASSSESWRAVSGTSTPPRRARRRW